MHTSLVDEHYNVSDTLVEKVVKEQCVTCPTLKFEIENLKGHLTHATSLSCICSNSSIGGGMIFKKKSSCH